MERTYLGKKVLVTGGLGFLGSNLCRALVDLGAIVTLIDNLGSDYGGNYQNIADFHSEIEVVIGDICNEEDMIALIKGKDILFNLASQTSHMGSMEFPLNDLQVNVQGQVLILELCRKYNPTIRIVYASTRQIYGTPEYLPVDETHPINPVDVNGINKIAAEQYHQLYAKVYNMNYSIIRMTNTYGPGIRIKDSKQIFLGIWIKSLIDKVPFKIYGPGTQLRDFLFIDDCVEAFLRVGSEEIAINEIYNIGGKNPISLLDLGDLIVNLGYGGNYQVVDFPKSRKLIDIGNYSTDYSKIYSHLSWKPEIDMKEGLAKTIDYYIKYFKEYT